MHPCEQKLVEFLRRRAERLEDDVKTHEERVAGGLVSPDNPYIESCRRQAPVVRNRIKELTVIDDLYGG
jgi:hypothetical protein